jgi:hypothetical protein
VAGHACCAERSLLGLTHGCSLARSALSLSVLSDLSSALPTLAAQRVADSPAAKISRGLTGPRKARSERILHRRQLQRREKRGSGVGPTKRGKGSKIMAIADGHGFPLAVYVASASPHETKLVEPTLDQRFLAETPERMIGDRAYDSDPLDQRIHERYGVQLIAPTNSCASERRRRTGAFCAATGVAGKWSVCSPGFITFVAPSFAGNTTQKISSGWSNSLAPSSS